MHIKISENKLEYELDRETHKIYNRIRKLKSEIRDLRYENNMIIFKVIASIIDSFEVKIFYLTKNSTYFEIELETFEFLFEESGQNDTIKLLGIIGKSNNDMYYLRY